jgi:hypothetical protein
MTKILIALLLLSGCAELAKLEQRGAEQTARAIESVCDESDVKSRDEFIAKVNEEAAPNHIEVTCGDD